MECKVLPLFLLFFLQLGNSFTCNGYPLSVFTRRARTITAVTTKQSKSSSSKKSNFVFLKQNQSNVSLRQTRNEFFISIIQNVVGTAALAATGWGTVFPASIAIAFEGGVGGLGKTKPNTGVEFWDDNLSLPVQNSQGIVSAELNVGGQPVLTSFQSPWPLLPTTTGLETRNLQTPESAFVQVVASDIGDPSTKSGMLDFLQKSILSSQGKFGAYGAPIDIKINEYKSTTDASSSITTTVSCSVTFTTFTPSLIETDRRILLKAVATNNSHWIVLVAGTTRQRFQSQESVLRNIIIDSFQVTPIPSQMFRAPKQYQREL